MVKSRTFSGDPALDRAPALIVASIDDHSPEHQRQRRCISGL